MLFGGKCAYCGCELPEKGWHADHAEPIVRKTVQDMEAAKKGKLRFKQTGECYHPELDNEDNLVPACKACNIYKGCSGVEEFRQTITRVTVNSLDRTQSLRAAKRFGIVTVDESPVTFWFEKYQQES
ncbi:HNH endonuclease [Providencia sp. PROV147]|uniref:HNH endonuclease n=1 Tax=Providencia sp. PROV147 TaxID=2949857 RepID=UPI0023491CA7|nr:HNH endonuclease signature motif containing protein [Providencia sp. PROV147]MDU7496235.1 HNH endonuclease signature motif containing protein [Providencia rettgeri]